MNTIVDSSVVTDLAGQVSGSVLDGAEGLARVEGDQHVLVGYIDGDPQPAGMARLARDGAAAEIAFEIADVHQGRGVGSIVARELAADARAAGIRELLATVVRRQPSCHRALEARGDRAPGELARPGAGVRRRAGRVADRAGSNDDLGRTSR